MGVLVVGVAGGYFFNVVLQGGTPGAYLASFGALAQVEDLEPQTSITCRGSGFKHIYVGN